ncbi:MAG TPA: ATP-binding protein [Micromonosporaceae bacterium]|nr:ATP-binding protein [Micromonosporaceae bacterium]
MGIEVRLALSLPRDRQTVSLTRRILDAALSVLGITRECRADIGLAVGEACANVVQHAREGADYEVTIAIHDDRCVIDIVDDGVGVDDVNAGFEPAGPDDESGRGLRIIRALADVVELRRRQPHGAALRIVKTLNRHSPASV